MAILTGEDTTVDPPAPRITERPTRGVAGLPMLVFGLALVLVGSALIFWIGAPLTRIGLLLAVAGAVALAGLTPVAPGEARVVQLFGDYRGTLRVAGLRWVNPFAKRRIVSTRIRNHETAIAKVNDADGNPIEIAAVVVWRVEDTARALYEVENVVEFVGVQTETAVRHVATSYPYDSYGSGMLALRESAGEITNPLSLRENAEEITAQLSAEIARRVATAGVTVIESRITRLSYAPEIAAAMLRRQQANAMVAARQRVVEGAVGMVDLALRRLEEQDIVELDMERKAAMVSNLLVVLCSDHPTAPVVNTGSLYH